MAMSFLKPSLMEWDGNKITDHNRSDLSVDTERIEESTRMANGTLRKYIIADKRTFSLSWKDLPHQASFAVDGFWATREIQNWYKTKPGAFTLKLHYGDGTTESITVMMTKCGANLTKRGAYDFWDVDVELTEV
jgi:hypothetical protein